VKVLEEAFLRLHERYCKILETYYPAHGSTGFTERNLTNNFVIALENVLGANSICWFEAPIDIDRRKHIDAVVFDLGGKRNFMIESKRFSNPEQKIAEARKDIERLKTPRHFDLVEKNLRGISIEERYAVLLADVWRENARKESIYNTWPNSVYQDACWSKTLKFDGVRNYSLLILAVKL